VTEQQYPEPSQATTTLVLGIIGLVCCCVLAPVSWWMGRKEVNAIDAGRRPPENRGKAQTGKVLGMIGTVVLLLAIPLGFGVARNIDEIGAAIEDAFSPGEEANRNDDGEIVATSTISVYDLEVGDCGDWPEDSDAYLTVTVHPCDTPHDFEVYLVGDMPDGPNAVWPGENAVVDFSDEACLAAFQGFVGISWEASPDLTYSYLYPSEDSWDTGDREILCTISSVDGTRMTGTREGSGLATD
jgi:hypothetical protein